MTTEIMKMIDKGLKKFSNELIKKLSDYGYFNDKMATTAIALSQGKYRIENANVLNGLKKSDIGTILFKYNCFEGLKASVLTKNKTLIELKIEPEIDDAVRATVELMRTLFNNMNNKLDEAIEFRDREIEKREKELKELKSFIIQRLIENNDLEGLRHFIFFHGDLDDMKTALQIAKEANADIMPIAEALADIDGSEVVAYLLSDIDEEKAREFASRYGMSLEEVRELMEAPA